MAPTRRGTLKTAEEQDFLNWKLRRAARMGKINKIGRLLKAGAEIDSKDDFGWTAVTFAAYMGQVGAIDFLVGRGADVNVEDVWGHTALNIAREEHVKEALKGHGAREGSGEVSRLPEFLRIQPEVLE